ncbi:hypothetical protein OOZ35_07655 [Mesoflavibacter profundi]|uniref:Uncharacterized protein n=1 Tax=Mesoflavibacter profundi TaxID=2708110 RepID=A0ABT4RZW1_9FLAO|nr:STM3941 family protein [Mesoflavibacter profundi]MDA0177360.1 hypothetical protein [Mesoflavibacter profundi]
MTEIKLYKSPWRAIKLILLCSIFVIGGIWLLTSTDSPKLVGWLSIGFFGLGYPVGLFNLFDRRPQIIINQEGIWDRTTKQNLINWNYIINAYPLDISGQKFVCLQLDEKFEIMDRQYKWASNMTKSIGAQKVNLHLGQIKKIDPNRLIKLIMTMSELDTTERNKKLKYVAQHGI